jgi:putative Ig domain-containing protein
MAANGVLSGTPTQPGSYPFTVNATDATGCTGTRSYSIDVTKTAATLCSCSRMTLKLRPVTRGVHLKALKHSFSLKFTWRTTCTGGSGGCKGTMLFAVPQVMTGSKPTRRGSFKLSLKDQTFSFAGRAHKTMRGKLRIVLHSGRQLKTLFGHTLVYTIVVAHGRARAVEAVRVHVTRRGFLR